MSTYDKKFFSRELQTSRASAAVIVPLILDLVKPGSVVDVGCGVGAWLHEFEENGISNVLGIDGEWAKNGHLEINASKLHVYDITKPIRLKKKFDLVLSLEVGEHLPKSAAKTYIKNLVSMGDVVAFSAAIPHQGGEDHINEQWQEYWAKIFSTFGYVPVDCIRKRIWNNDKVTWWYIQNTIMYVKRSVLSKYPKLASEYKKTDPGMLSLVHPRCYKSNVKIFAAMLKVLNKMPAPVRGQLRHALSSMHEK